MDNKTLQFILKMRDEASQTFDKFKGHIEGNVSKLKSTFSGLGGIIASAFSIYAIKKFIDASNEQEKASAKLGQSLKNAGVNSKEVQREMENYSSALQKVTKYGDEVITGVQTMLVAMGGVTGNALKPLTKATLDLASGLNMDAESAATLVAKTIQGSEALGRYGISTKGATTESERLDIVMTAIQKRFGDFAENEGKTAAGQMDILKNSVGELQEAIGDQAKSILKELMPAFNAIVEYGAPAILTVIKAIQMGFAALYTFVSLPFVAIEKGLNMLGISSSKFFQEFAEGGAILLDRYGKEMVEIWKKNDVAIGDFGNNSVRTNAEVIKLTGSIGALKEQQANLNKELENLDPTSTAFIEKSKELDDVETKLRLIEMQRADALKALRGETDKYTVSIGKMLDNAKIDKMPAFQGLPKMAFQIDINGPTPGSMNAFRKSLQQIEAELDTLKVGSDEWLVKWDELIAKENEMEAAMGHLSEVSTAAINSLTSALSVGFQAAFSGVEGAGKKFLKSIVNNFINAAEAIIAAAAAAAWGKSVLTFGVSLTMDLPTIALAYGILEGARAIVNSMHYGGTVGENGTIPLKSDERITILQVGETVLPKGQNGGGGNTFIFNINSPVPSGEWLVNSFKREMRKTNLPIEKLVVNTR